MTLALIFGVTLFLAYSNGANDNFKGVATLYGSDVVSFRTALLWGTVATFAGSLAAAFIGQELIKLFSGSGLVPTEILANPAFLTAVILGAGLTVFGATKIGIPISTTHALTGGLTGAGLAAAFDSFQFAPLLTKFLLPLAVAPLIPVLAIGVIFPVLHKVGKQVYTLLQSAELAVGGPQMASAMSTGSSGGMCKNKEISLPVESTLAKNPKIERMCDVAHFVSAGTVSFARGLNDTPKIVGIALAASALDIHVSLFAVAAVMAVGGLLHARRVAETMSHEITQISHGQGIVANLVTSFMVLFASRFGVPVSTTHVSVGAIIGIGVADSGINSRLVTGIVTAWVLTLPIAMALSAVLFLGLTNLVGS